MTMTSDEIIPKLKEHYEECRKAFMKNDEYDIPVIGKITYISPEENMCGENMSGAIVKCDGKLFRVLESYDSSQLCYNVQ